MDCLSIKLNYVSIFLQETFLTKKHIKRKHISENMAKPSEENRQLHFPVFLSHVLAEGRPISKHQFPISGTINGNEQQTVLWNYFIQSVTCYNTSIT